ncbi:hypothetical protein EMCG_03063, partial [[Emmonsia] crescens]
SAVSKQTALRAPLETTTDGRNRQAKRHRRAEDGFPNSTPSYDALTHTSYRSFYPGRVAIVRRLGRNQGFDLDCPVYLSSTVNTA